MKIIYKLSVFALGCVTVAACSDMDDITSEGNRITEEQVNETTSTVPERVEASLAGIYSYAGQQYCCFPSSTRDDDFGYPGVCLSQDLNGPDMVADNVGFNWFSVSSEYSDRNANYANPYMRYANTYNQIKLANDLLLSVDLASTDKTIQQYIAQAKAVRAFGYLCLTPYYQFNYSANKDKPCVPLVTEETTDFANNPRATVEAVYEQIMKDLNEAIELLSGYDRGMDKTRIDQQVAYGLRARANLYMGNWVDAVADAEKAMQGYTPYTLAEVSVPAFVNLKDHNWMWGIQIEAANITGNGGLPTWPSKLSSFTGSGYTTGAGCYKYINKLLFDKIPESDIRKSWWVDEKLHSANLANVSWDGVTGDAISSLTIPDVKEPYVPYTNIKFGMKSGIGSTTNDCDWCLMRVEEMILIKAEALAQQGKGSEAATALKALMSQRDASWNASSVTVDDVWFQRRVELWGEGFSMADIMRLNKPVVRFHEGKTDNWPDAFRFNIEANDGYLLLRFPQKETNNNAGIPATENNEGKQPVAGQNGNLKDGVTD